MKKNEYLDEVKEIYKGVKAEIDARLLHFKNVWERGTNEDIHVELSFCILTPQSKAVNAWDAITKLRDNGLLFTGRPEEISDYLNGVRFKNHKAEYLVLLREQMTNEKGKIITKEFFDGMPSVEAAREWIVKNIKGMAYKEAGHFLRNVGHGENIAILDRHILRNLVRLDVIENIPKTLNKKNYLEIEEKMRKYCKTIGINMDAMDLLLWYKEAGKVFK